MYKFIMRSERLDIYDIYLNDKRIRDENDFCLKIDETTKEVVFYNAYTAHKLTDTNKIIDELIELLKMISSEVWQVKEGYDLYLINRMLRDKLIIKREE